MGGAQAQFLDADDTAEPFGEQLRQDPGDRFARLLAVEPAAHPRGVGADVVGAHLTRPAVDLSRQLALGPAAAHEPRTQLCVGSFDGVGAAGDAVAGHVEAPIPVGARSREVLGAAMRSSVPGANPAQDAARCDACPRTSTRSRPAATPSGPCRSRALPPAYPCDRCLSGVRAPKVILRSRPSRGRLRKRHHSPPLRMNCPAASHD